MCLRIWKKETEMPEKDQNLPFQVVQLNGAAILTHGTPEFWKKMVLCRNLDGRSDPRAGERG
jgi:hypothetical protein